MNIAQQFLQQTLNTNNNLNHKILQQIQNVNSSLQVMLNNLQSLRDRDIYNILQQKIVKLQAYLQLRNNTICQLKSYGYSNSNNNRFRPNNSNFSNTNHNQIFQWLLQRFASNPILYQLLRKEKLYIQTQIVNIAKKTIIQPQYQLTFIQQQQIGRKLLQELLIIKQNKSICNNNEKILTRQKVRQVDINFQIFQQKYQIFINKVNIFNIQMGKLIKRIYGMDDKLSNFFHNHFVQNIQQQGRKATEQTIYQIIQQPNQYIEQPNIQFIQSPYIAPRNSSLKNSRKSSIQRSESNLNLISRPQIVNNNIDRIQSFTPRKKLTQKNSIYQQFYQNGKNSLNPTKNYLKLDKPSNDQAFDHIKGMNRTLGSFNYSKPQSISREGFYNNLQQQNSYQNQQFLYTTNGFGAKLRMPTKFSNINVNNQNQLSTFNYYPPR